MWTVRPGSRRWLVVPICFHLAGRARLGLGPWKIFLLRSMPRGWELIILKGLWGGPVVPTESHYSPATSSRHVCERHPTAVNICCSLPHVPLRHRPPQICECSRNTELWVKPEICPSGTALWVTSVDRALPQRGPEGP